MVKLLLEEGISPDTYDELGDTLLILAIEHRHNNIVRLLLEHGANKNMISSNGVLPIDIAKKKGNRKVILMLE